MCGIWFVESTLGLDKNELYKAFAALQHRGPDASRVQTIGAAMLGFHRLAINDVTSSGDQPMSRRGHTFICNGEIYNPKELAELYDFDVESRSDCEVIPHLYDLLDGDASTLCNSLDGVFACVIVASDGRVVAFRDKIGVRPLFYGKTSTGVMCFSSEIKGLVGICSNILEFPPGHMYCSQSDAFFQWAKHGSLNTRVPVSLDTLRSTLVASVKKRLSCDVPVGFFLSGGVDSSIVCAIAASLSKDPIRTFSIGTGESPDLECARTVSQHLGTIHTEVSFTEAEGINAIQEVISALESYDCTTVRASVPMYLLSKYVKENTDIKVLMSGEGADELFGGYLYMHYAPSAKDFDNETRRLVQWVHKHDVLRADRCVSAHGLELRVPFFDRALVSYVEQIDPRAKMTRLEKMMLRRAFHGMLPDSVLYRQKNGMSDAVGYSWVNSIRAMSNTLVDDDEYNALQDKYVKNCPANKEEAFYRRLYEQQFGNTDTLTHVWRPRWTDQLDPSATLLDIHKR